MTTPTQYDVESPLIRECKRLAVQAREAARELVTVRSALKNLWLERSIVSLSAGKDEILAANARDLAAAPEYGLSPAAIDRLRLDDRRLKDLAGSLEAVRALADPIGEVIQSSRRPNGLEVRQVRVPLGVIFFIYESRPNVTVDAAALCVKSGNSVILRGGKEAFYSNRAIYERLAIALQECGLPTGAVQLVQTTDREAVGHLLALSDQIDLAIPRGGESLIRRVVAEATMPVMKHFHGNCHIYIDADAEPDMVDRVVLNSKVQRPGVCNAAETVLVHRSIAPVVLPRLATAFAAANVELRGDEAARALVDTMVPATDADWDTEYLDLILAVKVVDSLQDAIAHIARHGSGHTEAILTSNLASARTFTDRVDSSCVVVNASTRFNDGGELGLGAEIGISTDKYHARGPCGMRELTSSKWIVYGDGHIRG